jgi:hypothetical protein
MKDRKDVERASCDIIWGTLPGGTKENHEKPVRIAVLQDEIWTRNLLITKEEC